ncbi:MAG: DUF1007 family protein [Alphaproteobacteria bacterium]|nr:DUF1007 family protein [Alphaproteobacteria bacterium]
MSLTLRRLLTPFAAALLVAFATGQPSAHPHIWINDVTTFLFQDGRLTGVRHRWAFDEFTGSVIIQDFDVDKNGAFDAAETARLQSEAFSNLHEFSYLTHIRLDGAKFTPERVDDFAARIDDGTLVYEFTLPLNDPVDPKTTSVSLGVYDETFYIYVGYDENDPVRFAGIDSGVCSYEVSEDKENPIYFGMVFPMKIELRCATS